MHITTVNKLARHVGEVVSIRGWLYNRRSKGKLHFLLIRDGTGIVQGVVFQDDVSQDLFTQCGHIPQESSLMVTGKVHQDAGKDNLTFPPPELRRGGGNYKRLEG